MSPIGSVTRLDDLLDFGPLLKPLATINLPKSPTFLVNFCKSVKIYNFLSEIIFGQLLEKFGNFFLVTLPIGTKHATRFNSGEDRFILFKLYICHLNWNVKRTKINKNRPGLAHFKKKLQRKFLKRNDCLKILSSQSKCLKI